MPASGGDPTPVVWLDDPTRRQVFPFSIGGDRVYFSLSEFESDIYAMDVEMH